RDFHVTGVQTCALPIYAPVQPWHRIQVDWVPWLHLQFHLGVDGISYPLVVLTTLLTLLCCLYTLRHVPEGGRGRTLVALLLAVRSEERRAARAWACRRA